MLSSQTWMLFMVMQSPCHVNANALSVIVAILPGVSGGEWLPLARIEHREPAYPPVPADVRENGRMWQNADCGRRNGLWFRNWAWLRFRTPPPVLPRPHPVIAGWGFVFWGVRYGVRGVVLPGMADLSRLERLPRAGHVLGSGAIVASCMAPMRPSMQLVASEWPTLA